MLKINLEPLSCTVYKVNSKLITYLNIRSKILKLLEENIGANFHDLD